MARGAAHFESGSTVVRPADKEATQDGWGIDESGRS